MSEFIKMVWQITVIKMLLLINYWYIWLAIIIVAFVVNMICEFFGVNKGRMQYR